ncbi:hypothetical protein QBC37DRAFT_464495 [Rhypophila decipiens]|uniref:Uncharacterized protein n=1 Tax=Rhypophila decipiens TaxID=261697 RepID=A0AAN7BAL8_9PEZI|nr:hypothetical protein QBC37DRAFT_464495 [Rhypophila decipiens]
MLYHTEGRGWYKDDHEGPRVGEASAENPFPHSVWQDLARLVNVGYHGITPLVRNSTSTVGYILEQSDSLTTWGKCAVDPPKQLGEWDVDICWCLLCLSPCIHHQGKSMSVAYPLAICQCKSGATMVEFGPWRHARDMNPHSRKAGDLGSIFLSIKWLFAFGPSIFQDAKGSGTGKPRGYFRNMSVGCGKSNRSLALPNPSLRLGT